MRIILWLAAGATAIGTAAAARPGGTGPGHGGLPGAWSGGGGHHKAGRGYSRFGIGPVKADRPHWRRHGRFDRRDFLFYGGGGVAGPVGQVDPYGNGFFTGGGGRIRLLGGHPYFDYDRAYPYEWAPAARAPERDLAGESHESSAPARCTFENGVRVCRGW